MNFEGIIPPLTTPFDSNGDLAPDKLQANIQLFNKYELSGYLLLGSNGEFVMLSDEEKIKVLRAAREVIPKEKIMLAGTGCQSTRETIWLTKKAAETGADAALVLNPFYYKGRMTREALRDHYNAVADDSSIPVLIYNMPASTGIDMEAQLIIELSNHPNIVGLKDSGSNLAKLGEIIKSAATDFSVFSGSAGLLLPALSIGAIGGILAYANIAPQQAIDLYNYFKKGQSSDAQSLQLRIIELNAMVTRQFGVPALKLAMNKLGLYGGPVRKPLLPLSGKAEHELAEKIEDSGLEKLSS